MNNNTWAMTAHLLGLIGYLGNGIGSVIAPLILWLVKKDSLPVVDRHGKEALNFNISVLIYGMAQRWTPKQFRVTLQGFFLPLSAMILLSHAAAGLWSRQVLQYYAISWPIMLFAFWLGNKVSRHIPSDLFERALYVALIVLGIALLIR